MTKDRAEITTEKPEPKPYIKPCLKPDLAPGITAIGPTNFLYCLSQFKLNLLLFATTRRILPLTPRRVQPNANPSSILYPIQNKSAVFKMTYCSTKPHGPSKSKPKLVATLSILISTVPIKHRFVCFTYSSLQF